MAQITLKGNPINTSGDLPAVGTTAPDFILTGGDLADVSLADYLGKRKLLNIVPSLDTGVCATSTQKFNAAMADKSDAVALVISADLPFASGRFCGAEGIDNVTNLSMMRSKSFAKDYGMLITDGPLAGLSAVVWSFWMRATRLFTTSWFLRLVKSQITMQPLPLCN